MIRMSPDFEKFSATPIAERTPTFVNNCQTDKGLEVAKKIGPALLVLLSQAYEFPSAIEVEKRTQGDCFISSMAAFGAFLQRFPTRDLYLVTGTFRNPRHDEVIFHCWLEFRGVVFNMSNMPYRPMYSIEAKHYRRHNHLTRVIQRMNADDLNNCLMKLSRSGYREGDAISADLILELFLKKTFLEQQRYFDSRIQFGDGHRNADTR